MTDLNTPLPSILDHIEDEVMKLVEFEASPAFIESPTPPDSLIMLSICVSLRRIADALGGNDEEYGIQQMLADYWADREAKS
jgi:hypothetical protein